MNAQTSQIDGVTGATVTSKAVQNAVADCIRQASGGAINPAEQTTEETASTADWPVSYTHLTLPTKRIV